MSVCAHRPRVFFFLIVICQPVRGKLNINNSKRRLYYFHPTTREYSGAHRPTFCILVRNASGSKGTNRFRNKPVCLCCRLGCFPARGQLKIKIIIIKRYILRPATELTYLSAWRLNPNDTYVFLFRKYTYEINFTNCGVYHKMYERAWCDTKLRDSCIFQFILNT